MSALPAAAWFQDPQDPAQWRWWDGSRWTEHVSPMATAAAEPVVDRRWPVPASDAPLFPRRLPGEQPTLAGRVRWRMLRSWPALLGSLVGSVLLAAFDMMLLSQRREPWEIGGPGSLSGDEYDELRSQGTSPIVELVRKLRDEARDDVWELAFLARGVDATEHRGSPTNWSALRMQIPVLAAAADVYPRWMRRSELRGFPAWWGELASIEAGDGGRSSMPRVHRHFAIFEIPPMAAERHVAVSVGPKRVMPKILGRRHGFDQVELESIAVSERLSVRVKAGSDPVAVRELFGPQLVAALADRQVHWDQRFEHLFVYADSNPKDPIGGLDSFLEAAVAVARAYWTDQS